MAPDATQSFTLVVNEAPAITNWYARCLDTVGVTSANTTTFRVGTAGSFTVTGSGFPAPNVSLTSGTLSAGVTFTPATGVLAGTPAAGTGGSYPLTFTGLNGVAPDATQTFTLTVGHPHPHPHPHLR